MKRIVVGLVPFVLSLAACNTPPEDDVSDRYRTSAHSTPPAPVMNAGKAGAEEPAGSTPLEELARMEAELEAARAEVERLEAEAAALHVGLEQLRGNNESLLRSADALREERDLADNERRSLHERVRALEDERVELLDQVLAERIQRVRTERELILAKIAEADDVADGS